MNRQQWGFLVGQRDDATFKSIFDSLVPGNQIWAGNASVLIAAVARVRNDDQTPDKFGPFELGLSVANLVLQAESLGLVAHQMGGLNPAAIREAFSITPEWDVFSVSAIGTRGDVSELPDALAEREIAPRVRNLISAVAFAGKWQTPAFDH
jgi:nitroreductase